MTNKKHTPGPWRVEERGPAFSSDVIQGPGKSKPIPLAWVAKLNEREANARLIAAAPDLLAALERVLGWARPVTALEKHDAREARALIDAAKGGK